MNQKLQNILDIIQQSEKLGAEQKDNLIKAVKDADKELEITAFKLERTEKVKKTTAILLEETIEELEQKRKAVEEQNRELEIESSLERVRAQAMGMTKSEDLLNICKAQFTELEQLRFTELRNSLISIFNDEKGFFLDYDYSDFPGGNINTVDYDAHPAITNSVNKIRKGNDVLSEFSISGKKLDEWNEYRRSKGERYDPRLENISAIYYYMYSIGSGAIGISTFQPISEEQLQILKRFRNVFDLSYQRYVDITLAEEQAREAQIQLALERVRARTMAMQKSDELAETAYILYEQFGLLGENPEQLTIGIIDETQMVMEFWLTLGGNQIDRVFRAPIDEPIALNKIYLAWKEKKRSLVIDISGDELKAYYNFFKSLPDYKEYNEFKKSQSSEQRRVIHYGFFSKGFLALASNEPKPTETIQILERFAGVLEQTYTRFLDLQKAEAQAREAQIEAALERIRAAMMAMHKSDELRTVVASLFKQLQSLGFEAAGCNVIVYHDDRSAEHWMTGYAHNIYPESYKIPYVDHPYFTDLLNAWQSGVAFEEFTFEGKMKTEYGDWLLKNSDFKNLPEEIKKEMTSPKLHVISDAFNSYGMLETMGTEHLQQDKIEILQRFSKVFEQTYTRFLDLQKAETQAREAQIEASLEKVRAVAMSMNKSEDLLSICEVSFKEFKKLGFDNIRNALIHIQYDEQKYFMDYDFSDLTGGAITKLEYGSHPVVEDYLQQIRSAKDAFYQGVIKEDQLEEWKDFRRNSGQIDDPRLDKATALYYYFFSIGIGDIGISTLQPINEYQIKILKRFRNVFDLAYRRYTDITKAEAQAREAQIEAALERVRAKAMAMHTSNDLSDAMGVLFTELPKLGINSLRCGVVLLSKNHRRGVFYAAATTVESDSFTMIGAGDMSEHPVFMKQYESWLNNENYFITLSDEDLRSYYNAIFARLSIPYTPRKHDVQTEHGYYFAFLEGMFYAWAENQYLKDEINLLDRFKALIDLTFRRYLDLQKAEAQAKEAIKQASLDRVRGEIASMRTSEDLNRITPIIWRELKTLEVPFIRCGVFIVDEDQQRTQVYLTTPDGKSLGVLNLRFGTNELAGNIVEQWKKKQIYKEHWNKEKFIRWTKSMMELGQVQNPETYQGSANPPESLDLHFVPFAQGMLYVGDVSPLTDEKLQLIKTLGEAFSIAYARYEDFKHLEDAKNKIELTLTELKSAQAQLVHSEKMASLGELTAGIAHEIKNPLNFVNNFSEVSRDLLDEMKIELEKNNIQDVIEIVTDLKQNLEKINLHGKRADSIVKGMLLHSRGSAGEKTLTDINELLDQYVNLAYHGMRAQNKEFNITIEKDYDNSLGKVNVIPQDISRVFLNIINNACYAAFDRKKQGDNNFNPVLNVSTKNLKDKVEVRIGDNGNGIPADLIDKIFQPFFTTKPSGEGTGLGLSLSYDIVKAHGGELKVKTGTGEGTVFTIDLPIEN